MSNFEHITPQEFCGAVVGGVDYGAPGRVLARDSQALLAWFPGHTSYVDRITGNAYGPTCVRIIRNISNALHSGVRVFEGGRVTLERLRDDGGAMIDEQFGAGVVHMIRLDATLALGERWFTALKLKQGRTDWSLQSSMELYDD